MKRRHDIPTCLEVDEENWEETFMEGLGAKDDSESLESDTEDLDLQPPPPK